MKLIYRIIFAFFILTKNFGGEEMVAIYVFMIMNDKMDFTFKNVPNAFKSITKLALEEMGVGHLAVVE